jgi:predicted aconitase with swiveling domain
MRTLGKSNLPLLHGQDLAAMINSKAEPIFAIEVVMAGIPLPDSLEENSIELMESGYEVCVHGDKGRAEMTKGTAK